MLGCKSIQVRLQVRFGYKLGKVVLGYEMCLVTRQGCLSLNSKTLKDDYRIHWSSSLFNCLHRTDHSMGCLASSYTPWLSIASSRASRLRSIHAGQKFLLFELISFQGIQDVGLELWKWVLRLQILIHREKRRRLLKSSVIACTTSQLRLSFWQTISVEKY